MTINHINLSVTDVAEAAHFFTANFGFELIDQKGNNMIAVLKGTYCFTLVLMSSTMNQNGNTTYPDAFHIGFMFDNADQVNETYAKLKSNGIPVGRGPGKIRNSFGFYFHYDGIMIEVGTN